MKPAKRFDGVDARLRVTGTESWEPIRLISMSMPMLSADGERHFEYVWNPSLPIHVGMPLDIELRWPNGKVIEFACTVTKVGLPDVHSGKVYVSHDFAVTVPQQPKSSARKSARSRATTTARSTRAASVL